MSFFKRAKKKFIPHGRFVSAQNYQEVHIHQNANARAEGLEVLAKHTVPGALHNSGERFDPPRCHPETRIAVLDKITSWAAIADTRNSRPILWLHGPAGAGKSAIAQTMAETWYVEGKLAASFFFARSMAGRNEKKSVIATIAYQLCQSFPDIYYHVVAVVTNDPLIFSKSLETQVIELIVAPLRTKYVKGGPKPETKVIVVDGLDECTDENAQREIILAFESMLHVFQLPVILLIASRPEPQIRDAFISKHLADMMEPLLLDNRFNPNADIELFLRCKLEEIKHKRWLMEASWPSETAIRVLVEKSSGQFIYASTVVKYIGSLRNNPKRCLDVVLGLQNPGLDKPFAEIDALYRYILSCVAEHSREAVMDILAFLFADEGETTEFFGDVIINNSPTMLEALLLMGLGDVQEHLIDMHSILDIPPPNKSRTQFISLFHASFGDFLADPGRSSSFFMDEPAANLRLAKTLFKHFILKMHDPSVPMKVRLPTNTYELEPRFRIYLADAAPSLEMQKYIEAAFNWRSQALHQYLSVLGLEDVVLKMGIDLYTLIRDFDTRLEMERYLLKCCQTFGPAPVEQNPSNRPDDRVPPRYTTSIT